MGVCVGLLVGVYVFCMDGSLNSLCNDFEGAYFSSLGYNGSDEDIIFIFLFCLLVWLAIRFYHG